MPITEHQKQELLSFNDGKPLIITEQGASDYNNEFYITAFLRTVSSHKPEFVNSVGLSLSFPIDSPKEQPCVRLFRCKLFHPNFTDEGVWSGNIIGERESLSDYLMRLIRVLQYKEVDFDNTANRNAMAWFNKNKENGMFPTDIINYSVKPQITILRINE